MPLGSASILWGETKVHEVVGGNETEAEGEDGAEAEDEEEGEGNDEAGGLKGGEGIEEQMPLHIYTITTDDESHCLGVVLIEECEDAHKVLYPQLNGDSFLRVNPEIPWGVFRHLVDQTFIEELKMRKLNWLVGKGVRIEDCNGNIEALDEMVRNYFSVHGDIDACALIYYTKLRNGFDRELSLEIEWDITIDGERHSLGDILFDSEINQVTDLYKKIREHIRLYHEVEGYVNLEIIDGYCLRYCTILDNGAERGLKFPNVDIKLNEFIHLLKVIIVCDRDPGDQIEWFDGDDSHQHT
ncbi:hypothetical protein ACE6H2_001748 [Prunus campanulata]